MFEAEGGLWAAVRVNQSVFRQEETKGLNVVFTLHNDTAERVDPQIGQSHIVIIGQAVTDNGLILPGGPRDARFGLRSLSATIPSGTRGPHVWEARPGLDIDTVTIEVGGP